MFADGEVTSQNIVGYVTPAQKVNTSTFGPAMQNVATGGLDMQKIIPVRSGDDKYVGGGGIYFQVVDPAGVGADVYYYYEYGEANGEDSPAGWYWENGEFNEPDAYDFSMGEGMVLTVPEEWTDLSFQNAGQVDQETTGIPLPINTSMFANTRPVTLGIQTIVPFRTGDDKYVGGGSIYFQMVDPAGVGADVYYYYEYGEANGEDSPAGWYWEGGEFNEPDPYTFAIGEGMVLTVPEDWTDAFFQVPAVGK